MVNVHALRMVLCITWIVTKLLSFPAWFYSERKFPTVPIFDFLEQLPLLHPVTFIVSMSALIAMIFRDYKWIMILLLSSEILSCMMDIIRWQPYQLFFILLLFMFIVNKPDSLKNPLILLMSGIYIYSGLHKFNGGFLWQIWDGMILRTFFELPQRYISMLHYMGLIVALGEVLIGAGLLFLKNKKIVIYAAISMHLFIVILNLSNAVNYIVLPWNIAMIGCLIYMFKQTINLSNGFSGLNKIALFFGIIMPALSFVGYWDAYLSWVVYNGNTLSMNIKTPEKEIRVYDISN